MSLPQAHQQGASEYNPSREDFASLLEESFKEADIQEGSVVKGRIVAIPKVGGLHYRYERRAA